MCAERTYSVSVFQTTSTKSKSLPPTAAHGCCSPKSILAAVFSNWSAQLDRNGRHIRLSKERQNKLDWTSTDPKHTHFVWDGTRLLQEYTYKGHYTYICANQDSCEPLAPVRNRTNAENENRQQTYYFHCDQISIPKEMTSIHGNLLWYGDYTVGSSERGNQGNGYRLPFRLQNQYYKGTSWTPFSNINAFIPTNLLTKRR